MERILARSDTARARQTGSEGSPWLVGQAISIADVVVFDLVSTKVSRCTVQGQKHDPAPLTCSAGCTATPCTKYQHPCTSSVVRVQGAAASCCMVLGTGKGAQRKQRQAAALLRNRSWAKEAPVHAPDSPPLPNE
jgi:hypothetical protein